MGYLRSRTEREETFPSSSSDSSLISESSSSWLGGGLGAATGAGRHALGVLVCVCVGREGGCELLVGWRVISELTVFLWTWLSQQTD